MPAVFLGAPGPVFHDPNQQTVHGNATVTSTGSNVFTGYGASQVSLFINVLAAPTGGSPTLQYTIQEVDPGDGTTVIGATETSSVITGVTVERITLVSTFGGSIKVSWTVGGSSPSFTQVYATLVAKAGSVALVDADGLAIGTANPLKIDPTGSTPQPVTGSVNVSVTGTTLVGGRFDINSGAWLGSTAPTVGQKAMASSIPIVFASDQSALPVSGTISLSGTVDVSDRAARLVGVVYGSQGQQLTQTATNYNLQSELAVGGTLIDPRAIRALTGSDVVTAAQGTAAAANAPWSARLSDGSSFYDAAKTGQFPAALVSGRLDTNTGSWFGSTAPTVGQKAMASSIPIVIASDQSAIPVSAASLPLPTGAAQDSTLTGGTAKAIVRGGAKGATVAADVTSTAEGSDHQSLDVQIYHGGAAKDPTAIRALTSSDVVTAAQGTPAAATVPWAVRASDGSAFINPALEHVTAGSPHSVRLSDGSAFYVSPSAAQLPSSLVGGRLDVNTGAWLGSTAPTVGQKAMASSIPVALASDQSRLHKGVVSTANSSTTPLGSSATFTGSWEDVSDFSMLTLSIAVDQASATDGCKFQWSSDGTNVDREDVSSQEIGGRAAPLTVRARYFRVVYINGSVAQGYFRLGVVYHQIGVGLVTRPISSAISVNNFVLLTKSILTGQRPDLSFGDVKVDDENRLIVTTPGSTATTKGFASGEIVLSATTVAAIRSTTYTEPTSGAQRSMASANANDTSGGTGARTVKITYYTLSAGTVAGPFTETITMNGTTPVNTVATNICYIDKLEVLTVGSTGSNVGIITLYGSTAGGGGTVWTIAATTNKTFAAHHYVPSGLTASITGFLGGIKGADTSGFLLRAKNPADANAAELQISDLLRAPSSGQSFRSYGTPIEVVGPSRITAYAAPDSSSSRTYYASFDLYEQ